MPKDCKAKQSYRTAWESLPDFKGWLQAVPGNSARAYCNVCNKTLYAHRQSLLQHMCANKHAKRARMIFTENEENKSNAIQCNKAKESMTKESINGVEQEAVLNTLETAEMDSSEDEAPNQYINSVTKPSQQESLVSNVVKSNTLAPISTHVLDSSRGTPVASLHVSLYKLINSVWTLMSECITNPVGRCNEFIPREDFSPGRFKLHFDVDRYFELRKQDSFYPFVEIVFDVRSPLENYHIPLILSPFGYSTYRGS